MRTMNLAATTFILLLHASPVWAQDAIIDTINQHRLLSVPTTRSDFELVYYEVCNDSTTPSAFLWKGPGFGVGARYQLPVDNCARKRVYTPTGYTRGISEITFQGLASASDVPAWMTCRSAPGENGCPDGLIARLINVVTNLEMFVSGPDDTVRMETITIRFRYNRESGEGVLRIRGSNGIEHIDLVLPETDAPLDTVREVFGGNGEIQIQTFGYFRDIRGLDPQLLARDIPIHSPVISIGELESDDRGFSRDIGFSDIAAIGSLATFLLLESGGNVAARNDMRLAQANR